MGFCHNVFGWGGWMGMERTVLPALLETLSHLQPRTVRRRRTQAQDTAPPRA